MATVWAKASANWDDTTNWAFWNENTQQIEDYGQVPQTDDVVYLNGYLVNIIAQTITVDEIRNDTNSYTNRYGGVLRFRTAASDIINCNKLVVNSTITNSYYQSNTNLTLTFNVNESITIAPNVAFLFTSHGGANPQTVNCPNIYMGQGSTFYNILSQAEGYCYINGNIYCDDYFYLVGNNANQGKLTFTIVGNVQNAKSVARQGTNDRVIVNVAGDFGWKGHEGGYGYTFTVTGNFNARQTDTIQALTLTGNLSLTDDSQLLVNGTLNIDGNIRFISTSTPLTTSGVYPTTLTVKNPTTFKRLPDLGMDMLLMAKPYSRDYPSESDVVYGKRYAFDEKVGTFTVDYPPETVVLQGYVYDNGEKTGSMSAQAQVGCVTKEDVREGVALIGMGEVGTLIVPSVDDVREGVVFDNGSVGTLIVQGGGDRLRIADFGYYTNAQSDTYIVDLTEQDKPKFAVAEERVLIEMFPDLDLDNIPDKYFDDLFVKYLKYRLIVEYYRTAGINSTFTPSEPTTEIVNYQNVRNEVWLNSANIYLKAWAKKYPESIVKPQRILL